MLRASEKSIVRGRLVNRLIHHALNLPIDVQIIHYQNKINMTPFVSAEYGMLFNDGDVLCWTQSKTHFLVSVCNMMSYNIPDDQSGIHTEKKGKGVGAHAKLQRE